MSNPLYQVVFNGELRPGHTPEQVKRNLAEQLNMPAALVEALFARPRVIVKRDIDFETARKYEQQFFLQGAIVKPESVLITDSTVVSTPTSTPAPIQEGQPSLALVDDVDTLQPATESVFEPSIDNDTIISTADISTADASSASIPPASALNSDQAEYPKIMPFEFTGNGKEYFKIWVVNIVLTILTLGIYSAWAKVRNKQYFYGNTFLDGASFEYTAKPLQILKGRLLAFLLVGIYLACEALMPPLYFLYFIGVALLIFIFVFPWVVVKGLQFNARHSNYRNINFGFDGSYWGAFKAFILWPIASMTIFLIPFSWHRQTRYFVGNSRYGTSPFEFSAGINDYYRIFGMIFGLGLGIGVLAIVFSLAGQSAAGIVVLGVIYMVGYFVIRAYHDTLSNNLMYNSTILKEHSLSSDYDVKSYLGLLFTNTLGIILTLGLFIPWALVRSARYHAEKTSFIAAEDLNNFVAAEAQHVNTLAEGLADTHDIFDIGVGI